MNRLGTNMRLGIREGLVIGAGYLAGSLVMVILRGPSILEQFRISLVGLVVYDILGGAATGAIVGLLLPLAKRSGIGAAIVGFAALLPICFIGTLIVFSPEEWHKLLPSTPLVSAGLLGGLGGPVLRTQYLGR